MNLVWFKDLKFALHLAVSMWRMSNPPH